MFCGFAGGDTAEVSGTGVWSAALPAKQPRQHKNVKRIRAQVLFIENAIVVCLRDSWKTKRGLDERKPRLARAGKRSRLENELREQLYLSRGPGTDQTVYRTGALPEIEVAQVAVGSIEVRVIQHIEHLPAKLH